MDYRGPILLVIGFALILSPLFINGGLPSDTSRHRSSYVVTDSGANATCGAAAMLRVDPNCNADSGPRAETISTRRVMEGGATFLVARR